MCGNLPNFIPCTNEKHLVNSWEKGDYITLLKSIEMLSLNAPVPDTYGIPLYSEWSQNDSPVSSDFNNYGHTYTESKQKRTVFECIAKGQQEGKSTVYNL